MGALAAAMGIGIKISTNYKRQNHFSQLLHKFNDQYSEHNPVPDDVIEKVQKYFDEKNISTATSYNTFRALKDMNLIKYYEHTQRIINRLNSNINNNVNNDSIINEIEQDEQINEIDEDFECAICFEENVKAVTKLNCNHKFCTDCINKLKKASAIKCPICRSEHKIKSKYNKNNNVPGKLTDEQMNKLKDDFEYFSDKFTEKTINTDRKNMLSYSYILYKLAEKNNIDLGGDPSDMLLRNREKLNYHEKMWNEIYPPTNVESKKYLKTCIDTDSETESEIESKNYLKTYIDTDSEIESETESETESEIESKTANTIFNAYKCHKCGEHNCMVQEFQSRSADEQIKCMITCRECCHSYIKQQNS